MCELIATATTTPPVPELKPKPVPELKPKPNRAYSSALMIRMTPAQNELLHKLAADAGMNVSTYVRVKLKLQKA